MIKNVEPVNASTDKLLLAFYPPGAGGKFLLNCLGLSKFVVLQDATLAGKQLKNQLSEKKKLTELLCRLSKVNYAWNDLELGCFGLFGEHKFKNCPPSVRTLNQMKLNPIISQLSHSDQYFPLVVHTGSSLHCIMSHWPNAKIIQFINYKSFVESYRPSSVDTKWIQLRGPQWPANAPKTVEQYWQLDTTILSELKNFNAEEFFLFNLTFYQYIDQFEELNLQSVKTIRNNICYVWNTDWYLDKHLFVEHLQNLYNVLEIGTVNYDYVLQFRNLYLKKLLEVSATTIK